MYRNPAHARTCTSTADRPARPGVDWDLTEILSESYVYELPSMHNILPRPLPVTSTHICIW